MVKFMKLVFMFWNLRCRWKFRNKCVILKPLKFWGFPQSHFLVFTIKFHSPCMWAKTNYLIPLSRIWQKWWLSVPKSGYKDCRLSCLHCLLPSHLLALVEQAARWWASPQGCIYGRRLRLNFSQQLARNCNSSFNCPWGTESYKQECVWVILSSLTLKMTTAWLTLISVPMKLWSKIPRKAIDSWAIELWDNVLRH